MIGTAAAQVSKETLESITTPDKVETSIGTLNFMDGAPSPETARKVYDYLDTVRGVDAFLKGMRGASMRALINGVHTACVCYCNVLTRASGISLYFAAQVANGWVPSR